MIPTQQFSILGFIVVLMCACSEKSHSPREPEKKANLTRLAKPSDNGIAGDERSESGHVLDTASGCCKNAGDGSVIDKPQNNFFSLETSLTLAMWNSTIKEAYGQRESRKAVIVEIQRCERLKDATTGPTLSVKMKSKSDREPFDISIRVSKRNSSVDVYGAFWTKQPAPDFCVQKENHLVFATEEWLIELLVPCRAGRLLNEEIEDFVSMTTKTVGEVAMPKEILLSTCGKMKMQRISLKSLRQTPR